ncbi:hypothetical protein AB833_05830 [Chromatiales bacterium (ex Bugula neritina AB1)]|nr:hypothetical protein AB833_05830 [Chromatiales bacterium (ex Bugula neritina AB1)]
MNPSDNSEQANLYGIEGLSKKNNVSKINCANIRPNSNGVAEILEKCQSLIKESKFQYAVDMLHIALMESPQNIALNGVLADSYYKLGRYEDAIQCYEKVISNSRDVPHWAMVGCANVMERQGDDEGAYRYLRKALAIRYSADLAKRALMFLGNSSKEKSITEVLPDIIDQQIEDEYIRAKEYLEIAEYLRLKNQFQIAYEFYKKAIEIKSDLRLPATRIVCFLLRKNCIEQAKIFLERWKARNPGDKRLRRLEDICNNRSVAKGVRTIAFYLPQYHPTKENDEWWGKGFTEWHNVASAKSMWAGHCQPRLPTDLGYYDLRLPETYNSQTAMASEYGVDGLCFYYYWFNGRKILDTPLQNVLDGKTNPFPFCICWVNENWTRSWDGMTGEVLLSTEHSLEMNARFIEDTYPILANDNYIRVDGKPILIVYCAEKLDSTIATTEMWRDYCRSKGLGEIYICAVQSFGFGDPTALGYDAAIEFPPHAIPGKGENDSHVEIANVENIVSGFSGKIYSYQRFADAAMDRPREDYTLHRTCMLSWDNTARRGKQAHVYAHFSVDKYQQWLSTNMRKALVEQKDPLVFINAWNEWAEGSSLEPDREYGYELLAATRRAKRTAVWNSQETYWKPEVARPLVDEVWENEKILMIGHDACKNGAQINFLYMLKNLVRDKNKRVTVILKSGGDLLAQYEQYGEVYVLDNVQNSRETFCSVIRDYYLKGVKKAICNTCVTGDFIEDLSKFGYSTISLVHELPGLIEEYGLSEYCDTISKYADSIVFASEYVAEKFKNKFEVSSEKTHIHMQGIKSNPYLNNKIQVRSEMRAELGLPDNAKIVSGCGYGDIRKGIDLFIQLASVTAKINDDVYFVWVGDIDVNLKSYLCRDIVEIPDGRLLVTGYRDDSGRILAASDAFALTSREDPFPSVIMEAMEAGLPVFGFEGCGGYDSIINERSGALVPFGDLSIYSNELNTVLVDENAWSDISDYNAAYASVNFGYQVYMDKLLELLHAGYVSGNNNSELSVSVIVPNYNYEQYLRLRLTTIFQQSRKPDEVIILDDNSSDESMRIIREFESIYHDINIVVVENKTNSGNLFLQWKRGIEQASGDIVWIAEADDYCDQDFLRVMCERVRQENVNISFCNSIMVDEFGSSHGANYNDYYFTHFNDYFEVNFTRNGVAFVNDVMTKRNAVMNASAVVFRREKATRAIENLGKLKLSGDWLFWIELCMAGDINYTSDTYNYHRRHKKSVLGRALEEKSEIVSEMLTLLDVVNDRYGEDLSEASFEAAFDSIKCTYQELFNDDNGEGTIESHPELASAYLRVREMICPKGLDEAIEPVFVRKQVSA